MSGKDRAKPSPKQPPEEQPVQIEVWRDLTTGGRVTVVVEAPREAWFRQCQAGDAMLCKVLRVIDTQERQPPEPGHPAHGIVLSG